MPVHNIESFVQDLDLSRELVREDFKQRMAILVGNIADFLNWRTTELALDTGALRASNELVLGSDGDGQPIYRHPQKPGADQEIKSAGRPLFQPMNPGNYIRAIETSLPPLGSVSFRNERFYAPDVEFGGARMAPRRLYGSAEDMGRAMAELVVRRPSEFQALR